MKQLLEINKHVLEYINNEPTLLSYLYDVNLLPEQITGEHELTIFTYIVEAYIIGKES